MVVIIERAPSTDQGTFGIMILSGGVYLYTAELPWKDNKQSISCIPAGSYQCVFRQSEKNGNVFQLQDVPNRLAIQIHRGNYAGDVNIGYKSNVEGCILVGTGIGILSGQLAVLSSAVAFEKLRDIVKDQPFQLDIVWGKP